MRILTNRGTHGGERFFKLCQPLVSDCKTPEEAAQKLNATIFNELAVKYSTQRKRANQSPSESIEQGLASCTGLSIILVDACRSVGVPARLAGIPKWKNKNGNHTWVELWSEGDWHFTGAAEYNPNGLNQTWFQNDAALADPNSKMHSIYATSFGKTETVFPNGLVAREKSLCRKRDDSIRFQWQKRQIDRKRHDSLLE